MSNNIKIMAKNKIIKVLIRVKIDNIGEILIKILLNKIKNPKNIINGASINKIIIIRNFKKKVGIWLVLVIVIAINRFNVNKEFRMTYIDFIKS